MVALANIVQLSDPGPLPKLRWIVLDLLVVDPRYQRTTESDRSKSVIRQISEAFCWSKCQPLTVCAIENGLFAILDGQHRKAGAQARGDIPEMPCMEVVAPDVRTQARSFMAINRDRVAINFIQLHHAAVTAGEPDASHVAEVCQKLGIKIPSCPKSHKDLRPRETVAIGTISKCLKLYGEGPVLRALKSMIEAFHTQGGALRGTLINGVVQFFFMHKGQPIDLERVTRALSEHDAADLDKSATVYRQHFKVAHATAIRVALTKSYNRNLKAENKLPEEA